MREGRQHDQFLDSKAGWRWLGYGAFKLAADSLYDKGAVTLPIGKSWRDLKASVPAGCTADISNPASKVHLLAASPPGTVSLLCKGLVTVPSQSETHGGPFGGSCVSDVRRASTSTKLSWLTSLSFSICPASTHHGAPSYQHAATSSLVLAWRDRTATPQS